MSRRPTESTRTATRFPYALVFRAAVVAEVTQTVADPAVRHRGTFGGSIAHADPAGDLPALALALDASMEIAGSGGRRKVPAKIGRGLVCNPVTNAHLDCRLLLGQKHNLLYSQCANYTITLAL